MQIGMALSCLKYYELSSGFAEDGAYTDSEELFDALWEEWLNTKLYLIAKEMKLEEIHYEEVFDSLPEEKTVGTYWEKSRFCQSSRNMSVISVPFRNQMLVSD